MKIRVVDNDKDEISIMIGDSQIRGWSYSNDAERRQKMQMAHEYAEGWYDGTDVGRDEGFNDGWDAALNEAAKFQ